MAHNIPPNLEVATLNLKNKTKKESERIKTITK
jgi:hypothetical protein